ncbi:hypothetical protein FOL47_011365 [Perkinsus chesapeaki]|uniref:Uncharacterized protein n=1 Tax=Perkinsus chesapeaki TaxID=330153 RepID=A0A7J6MN64_PERCH|nr:hypothetical protein FOL47_011365 [Perkinsus chesapeaki]
MRTSSTVVAYMTLDKALTELARCICDDSDGSLLGRIRAANAELIKTQCVIEELSKLRWAVQQEEKKREKEAAKIQLSQPIEIITPKERKPLAPEILDPVEAMLKKAREALMAERMERKIDRPSYKRPTPRSSKDNETGGTDKSTKTGNRTDNKMMGKLEKSSSSTNSVDSGRCKVDGSQNPGDGRNEEAIIKASMASFVDDNRSRISRFRRDVSTARRRAFGEVAVSEVMLGLFEHSVPEWEEDRFRAELLRMALPVLQQLKSEIDMQSGSEVSPSTLEEWSKILSCMWYVRYRKRLSVWLPSEDSGEANCMDDDDSELASFSGG